MRIPGQTRARVWTIVNYPTGGGLLIKVSYGEDPRRGSKPSLFNVRIFNRKGTPSIDLEQKLLLFLYLKNKPETDHRGILVAWRIHA